MVLQFRKPQAWRSDGLVEVLHEIGFRHRRQLVQRSIVQACVVAAVELRAGVGRVAQLLQGLVLMACDPGEVPAFPLPPCGPQEQHPGDEAQVHPP